MASLVPFPKFRAFDANGNPLVGGKLFSYQAGTSTPLATYTDQSGVTPNTNPVVLDANGEANVWVESSSHKFILKDANDVTQWTVDNITPFADIATVTAVRTDLADSTSTSKGDGMVAFKQPYANTQAKTVHDKLAESISIKDWGAVGDNINNDATVIANAIAAYPVSELFVPPGTYRINSNLTIPGTISLRFARGAVFVIPTGVTLTYSGQVVAGDYQIFSISGGTLTGVTEAPVTWFGGLPAGAADNTPVVQAMINAGVKVIKYGVGSWQHSDSITIPQAAVLHIKGAGFRETTLTFSNATGKPLFTYGRTISQSGATCTWEDLVFSWTGTAKLVNSRAIKYYGYADGQDDNWMRVYRCMFYNFEAAIDTKWTGQSYFVDNFYQGNRYSHLMYRGSSFFYMRGEMSFDGTFVNASDTTHDAYSNGLVIEDCNNITATNENLSIEGWQAVYIAKCGWDLGSGGTRALWFYYCQDVTIDSCFISSNNSVTREGVGFDATHTYHIKGCTIVNNAVGIRCTEPPLSLASKGVIDGNKFAGNATNDVLIMNNCEAIKVLNNHFEKQQSRTNTNYEIYANLAGVNNCIIQFNTFKGVSYTISAGANSIVGNNIFSTKQ